MRASCRWLTAILLPHPSFELIQSTRSIKTSTSSLFADKRRFAERSARQEERIYELEKIQSRTCSQESELDGLKQKVFVEQYDPALFNDSHKAFKEAHNRVFAALCRYCKCNSTSRNIFFLDGQDAGTATALSAADLSLECCYVANRHKSTCIALAEWGLPNIAHGSAQQVLSKDGTFHDIPFCAFYFDGCGGHAPIIVDMLTAALDNPGLCDPLLAVGISIVGGNRDVVNKELTITRALVKLAKARGLRVDHVLDDCERYGITEEISKVEGNTLTTWFLLEEDLR